MASWKTVESDLVDSDVAYCDGDDVFVYIGNKSYDELDGSTSPTSPQVDNLIDRMSERVDKATGRAWRVRKVEDAVVRVKLSHKQRHSKHRRRRVRGKRRGDRLQLDIRGLADLPHFHLQTIDSNEGDKVEVLKPREANDITDNEGRESGDFVVDERKGIIRPEINQFTQVGTRLHGPIVQDPKIRVTYRYGLTNDPTDNDGDGVSDTVPGDVREATALMVAAKLIDSDQFGELLPANTGDSPDLSQATDRLRSDAEAILDSYRRV